MSGKTFFQHGIPPLGKRSGSKSKGSVSKEKHYDATVIEQTDEDSFGLLPDDLLNRLPATSVWVNYEENGELAWGSESDIQGFVKGVLQAAIRTLGLTGHIKCCNELSIFDLRPDVWLVCADGVPIGVAEVKKPDGKDILRNKYVQGQLFDYMLRLKSFFGLEHVFGFLSTYEEWRVCWMPQSQKAAVATVIVNREADEVETEAQPVVPQRVMNGSPVFRWNDPNLPHILCSTILKMYNSPRTEVRLIDKSRPYIIIDENQWSWGQIAIQDESYLYHSVLPTANKFTLLADLREGADGRVWRACTDAGVGCCIKFPMRTRHGEKVGETEQLNQMMVEEANWHAVYGSNSARVITLCGRPALIMRYLRPLELQADGTPTQEDQAAVKTAIEKFAQKGYKHTDLALRHVGFLSPPQKKKKRKEGDEELEPEVVLFDLGQVDAESDPAVAVAEMFAQLHLLEE